MAVLTDDERRQITNGMMRYFSEIFDGLNVSKAELRIFVNETDVWINDNRNSYATSISEPAASNMTGAQQTLGFACVALMRKDIELLKQALGQGDLN